MIPGVLRICPCGRTFTATVWAHLEAHAHDEVSVTKLCSCRRSHRVERSEHEAAVAIADLRARRAMLYSLARLEVTFVRTARYMGIDAHLGEAARKRCEARQLTTDVHTLERLLESIYRARELAKPSAAVGRRLTEVRRS